MINWGLIGLGKISNKFAEALKLVPDAARLAVASRDLEKAQDFAAAHGFERAYGSYEALFQDAEVQAVYVGTPHVFHAENAIRAMEHGKAVLCEKPIAMSRNEAERMFDCAKNNSVFLMEALWTRFLPSFIELKNRVEGGEIGEVKSIMADFGFRSSAAPESRIFNPALGGGSVLDVGIYPLFFAINLLGKPKSIKAVLNRNAQGTDDSCGILLGYDGAIATLNSSVVVNQKVEAAVFGTTGTLQLDNRFHEPTTLSVFRNFKLETVLEFEKKGSGMHYQVEEVHRCLAAGLLESPMMSRADSLLLQEVMDEVLKNKE